MMVADVGDTEQERLLAVLVVIVSHCKFLILLSFHNLRVLQQNYQLRTRLRYFVYRRHLVLCWAVGILRYLRRSVLDVLQSLLFR